MRIDIISYDESEDLIKKQLSEIGEKIREESVTTFYEHTSDDDCLIVTLKSHLHLENELDDLLKKFFNKKFFEKWFRNVEPRLEMARELELIGDDVYKLFNKLRDIRNKYAHNLNFGFKEKDYHDLVSVVSKPMKTNIELFTAKMLENEPPDKKELLVTRYRALLSFLLMMLLQNKFNFLARTKQKFDKLHEAEFYYLESKRKKDSYDE